MHDRVPRRALLSGLAVGISTAGAGCLGGTSSGRTLSMGETATSSSGVSVAISEPRVRKIIFTPDVGSIAHSYPAGSADSQFLVVSVSAAGADVASLRLVPVLDGTERESETYRHAHNPGDSGLSSVRVPLVDAERGELEWRPSSGERFRWTLPESVVADLGRSPAFEVQRFAVPETIARGDDFEATLDVTNAGDRDGRFLAVVLDRGPSSLPLVSEFTAPVPAGERTTRTVTGRTVESERASATAVLDWGVGRREAPFSVSG